MENHDDVSFESFKETVVKLDSLVKGIHKKVKSLENELDVCDKESQDILHMIELSNFHASKGYNLAKDLQVVRKKRRRVKDELDALSAIKKTLNVHRPIPHQAQVLASIVGEKDKKMKNRSYTPRVRLDMAEEFEKL